MLLYAVTLNVHTCAAADEEVLRKFLCTILPFTRASVAVLCMKLFLLAKATKTKKQ
jgi:hypothetical protein